MTAMLSLFACFVLSGLSFGRVLDLTDRFDEMIQEHDVMLVKFFAPWCGHCKKIAPEFQRASDQISGGALGEVDCTADKGKLVCQKYDIKGYPTLKLFRKGKMDEEYNGGRDAGDFVSFMTERTTLPIIQISSVEELTALLEDKLTLAGVLMGYFVKSDDSGLKHLTDFADRKHSIRFAYSTEPKVIEHSKMENKLVYYMPAALRAGKLEPSEVLFSGNVDSVQEIEKFLVEHRHGGCAIRTMENKNQFESEPHLVVYTNIDLSRNAQDVRYTRNRVVKASIALKSKYPSVKFAISDANVFEHELGKAGLHPDKSKKHTVMYDKEGKRYVMEKPFGHENIVEFVSGVMDGSLSPSVKSEAIPEQRIDDYVHVVVAKNFDDVVVKSGKDTFIEFYAPWCGHCKKLAPVLSEVAKELYESSTQLTIAKMNAIDNDVPNRFSVDGFPTMYFIPAGDTSKAEVYSGGRTKEDFIKFLAEKSTQPLKGYDRDGKKLKSEDKEL